MREVPVAWLVRWCWIDGLLEHVCLGVEERVMIPL